jgi:plasmid stabilization system protein ParE
LTAAFVFHPGAEAEPREIVRYMRREWGEKQARAYAAKLRRRIQARASGTKACKDMSALYPGVRMVRCEHHYIFCVPQHAAPVLAVAMIHERMDVMARLAERLK